MNANTNERQYWVGTLAKIAHPVMSATAQGKLRQLMPVEAREEFRKERRKFTHLEALGRSLAGIGPWLASSGLVGEEEDTRRTFQLITHQALEQVTDPQSRVS